VVASPLPDRERRHLLQFHVAPKLEYRTRLTVSACVIVVGLGIQLLIPFTSVVTLLLCSIPVLFVGNLFLLVRGYNLKPKQPNRNAEWEKTTRDRFQKTRDMENEVKRWDESFTDLTCVSGVVGLFLVVGTIGVFWLMLQAIPGTRFWSTVFVADAAVLILPHWITGTRRGWRPIALRQQIDALEKALRVIEAFDAPPCQIQPMFEMAGEKDHRVPTAARVFVRFPDGPEEFLGVQFQVSLNNVQGTNYPYLYAVIVAKPEFGLLTEYLPKARGALESDRPTETSGWMELFRTKKRDCLTVTVSREKDVDVVVVRQTTTKNSGYHTDGAAIARIAGSVWQGTTLILAEAIKKQAVTT
jgi:hypothetical protein